MPKYESPGTENLRADAHVYAGSENESPASSAKDAGGTENLGSVTETKTGAVKEVLVYSKDNHPAISRYNGETA